MTISTTPRFGFKQYSAGTDPHPNRDEFNALLLLIENNATLFAQNVTASRPAAGKQGRYFWDTTVDRLYYDNGTAWKEVTTNGGGGSGTVIVPGAAASEGTSSRSARADHTHNLPLATSVADGAMSATDKALLDAATSSNTNNALVKRAANGAIAITTGTSSTDAANKGYVDVEVATRAAASHSHDAAAVTSGTFAAARLPNVTTAVNGAMLATDKVKLDGAASAATASKLVVRDAAGRAQFADPLALADAVTKGFLDTQLLTKSPNGHTHAYADITGKPTVFPSDWTSVTGKPLTYAPSAHTHAWGDIVSGLPATWAPSAHTHPWIDVTGKPLTFAPSAHTHAWGDLTAVPATFAPVIGTTASTAKAGNWVPSWAEVSGKPTTFTPGNHVHWASDIQMNNGAGPNLDVEKDNIWNAINGRLLWSEYNTRVSGTGDYSVLRVPNNGNAYIAVEASGAFKAPGVFNTNAAYGSYRAVWTNGDGYLGYNLSSRKYKVNEHDYVVPLDLLKTVSPQWFQYKHDIEALGAAAAPERVNFIAEDLHDAGLTEYVSYNDESMSRESAETINEQLMVNALWSFAQQQQTLIEGMRKELDELKAGK